MIKKLSSMTLRRHKGISFVGVTAPFICYDRQGRIFMAKRSTKSRDEHGRWDCGGGGVKHGQTVIETVKREMLEEYGAIALKIDFIGYFETFRTLPDGTPTHWLAMPHAVLVDADQIKIIETDMFDDSGWFILDNLPSPLHSAFENVFLPKYKNKLQKIFAKNIRQS